MSYSPAKNTKNQIQHKKRTQHNQRYKIHPVEVTSNSVVHLQKKTIKRVTNSKIGCLYPVKDRCPSFHGNALEYRQHGKTDVIERRNATIWPLPPFQTHRISITAPITALRLGLSLVVRIAGHLFFALLDDLL